MVRRQGKWGKLCARGIVSVASDTSAGDTVDDMVGRGTKPTAPTHPWGPLQLGEVVCKALTFRYVGVARCNRVGLWAVSSEGADLPTACLLRSGVDSAQLVQTDKGQDDSPFFETAINARNATDERR